VLACGRSFCLLFSTLGSHSHGFLHNERYRPRSVESHFAGVNIRVGWVLREFCVLRFVAGIASKEPHGAESSGVVVPGLVPWQN